MDRKSTEWDWYYQEVCKDMRGEDSWLGTLGLLLGHCKMIGWKEGEEEAFKTWKAKALGHG